MPAQSKINWDKHPKAIKKIIQRRSKGDSFSKITEAINKEFQLDSNVHMTKRAYHKYHYEYLLKEKEIEKEDSSLTEEVSEEMNEDIKYKESHEILENGAHKSDKLIKMSEEDFKDKEFLLKAHGFDPKKWHLVNARNNAWNVYSKKDGIQVLYSSKITVREKDQNEFDFLKLEELLNRTKKIKPIPYNNKKIRKGSYLNVPLFDLHFGNNTLEDYEETLENILAIIHQGYEEIIFIVGQDLLHNDNFRGTTSSGTVIDKVNMENAWDDAEIFYRTLIDAALKNSKKVFIMYSKGNHDESMAWAFVKTLESKYEENDRIEFDTKFKERKAYLLGTNFIGTTHGDKNRNNAAANFSVEFPEMWAKATTREVYMGHFHRKRVSKKPVEVINDADGLIIRELGTGNNIDQYHEDNGYTLAHKEFEVFEYTEEKKQHIYYV